MSAQNGPGAGEIRPRAKRGRQRRWRWLVVLHDLPPMPRRAEVVWGYLTKRRAEHEALMLRYAHDADRQGARMVRVEVQRG